MRGHPVLKTYAVASKRWTGADINIAVIADLHVISPWVSLAQVEMIAKQVNRLQADVIVLAGDFLADSKLPGRAATARQTVDALSGLHAPLGVFAVLGNHDWADCPDARTSAHRQNSVADALNQSDIHFLHNSNIPIQRDGHKFWMVGFDSQRPAGKKVPGGYHNPDKSFQGIPSQANSILIAHEPDYFAQGDDRAILQISGHTHGGQMNLFGWRPMTPSRFRGKYAYGHHHADDRHMVVSAGIGFSGLPLRIGQPPEVNLIKLRKSDQK